MFLRATRLHTAALLRLRPPAAALVGPAAGLSSSAATAAQQHQQRSAGSSAWRPWAAGLAAAAAAAASTAVSHADSSSSMSSATSLHLQSAQQQHYADERQHHDGSLSNAAGSQGGWFSSTALGQGISDSVDTLYTKAENWLMDLLQQSSDVHVAIKLLALSGALLPLILISGLVYNRASGVPLSQSLYKMYCLLYRVEGVHEPNVPAYFVSNIVFMLGFFTLALLLGVVNDEVQRRSDDARCGRNPVHAEGHVLLLNWNRNSPALLHSIAMAEAGAASDGRHGKREAGFWGRQPAVVVLADKDKSEMDAAVQECVKDRGLRMVVHTRQGSVFKPSHLRKVSASEASTIILLHPEHVTLSADAEALKAAAAMCFKTLSSRGRHGKARPPQRMIVQMPSSAQSSGNIMKSIVRQSAAAAAAQGSTQEQLQLQVLSMPDDTLVNRIIAQTAVQPGILTVWQDILNTGAHSSNLFCPVLPPESAQLSYRSLRRWHGDAVLCGYIDAGGEVQLNPPDDSRPGPGSRLILLRRIAAAAAAQAGGGGAGVSAQERFSEAAVAAANRLHGGSSYKPRARKIIVAAWSRRETPELIRSLIEFTPPGSSVTFITEQPPERSWLKEAAKGGNCRISFQTHKHPTSTETLLAAGIRSADTVVLGTGSGEPNDLEADARVLASLLQVQEAVLSSGMQSAPHLVCPIREHGSSAMAIKYLRRLAKQMMGRPTGTDDDDDDLDDSSKPGPPVVRPEFLVFRDVTSAVLAHVVAEPAYADIITNLLFSCEGNEVYLRSPESFNIPLGVPISFAEVAEAARLTNQTAVGLCRDKRFADPSAAPAAPGAAVDAASSPTPAQKIRSLSAAAEVELALPGSEVVTFEAGDSIVALATDFVVPPVS